MTNPFEDVVNHDSKPTIPLTPIQCVRFSKLAEDLQDVKIQGYIEANFGIEFLEVLRNVIPLLAGLV